MEDSIHVAISHLAAFQHHHCYRNLKLRVSNVGEAARFSMVPAVAHEAHPTLADAALDKGNDVTISHFISK